MNLAAAIELVMRHLSESAHQPMDVVMVRWVGFGWIIFVESSQYMKTLRFEDRAIGQGGTLVTYEGEIVTFVSSGYWREHLVLWAQENDLASRLDPSIVSDLEFQKRSPQMVD